MSGMAEGVTEGWYMEPVRVRGCEIRPKDLLLERRAPDGRAFVVGNVEREGVVVTCHGTLGDREEVVFFGTASYQWILPWFQPLLHLFEGD